MKRKNNNALLFVLTAFGLLVFSCVTINVYFPAAAVQDAANKFVEEVQSNNAGNPPPKEGDGSSKDWLSPDGEKSGSVWPFEFEFIRSAHAQKESDININTPLANQMKESIKNRFPEVAHFKDLGAIGENNRGILTPRDVNKLPLNERGKMNQVMSQENGDRMKLYMEVLRANSYPQDKLEEIQKIFAKSWQQQAKGGWLIQDEGGQWKQK